MNMKNITMKFSILLLFLASACKLEGDLVDPNQLTPSVADPNTLISGIQLNFADFFSSASAQTDQLVRMNAMTGGFRYQTAILPTSVDLVWRRAYQQVLINTQLLVPLAASKKFTTHVAMAKIFEAYIYLTLVDMFNDVPQTDALKGLANFSPKADNGTDVYAKAIALLTEARVELAKTGTDLGTNIPGGIDLYYGGNRANWTALTNSLELKAWMNIRMIASRTAEADVRINALLVSNLINTEAENFNYRYGVATVPDSRHPVYNQFYGPNTGSASGYICNDYLYKSYGKWGTPFVVSTAIQDPRWRYYFYRQVGSSQPSVNGFDIKALGCAPGVAPAHYQAAGSVYCVFEPGFYGRDHGDGFGTPPDSPVITCAGVYPAGGRPDNNSVVNTTYSGPTKRGDGANGGGIEPIYMYFFTDYLIAEYRARTGDVAGAKTALLAGITNSIAQVKRFSDGKGQSVTISPWTSTPWTPTSGAIVPCGPPPASGIPPSPAYLNCLFNNFANRYLNKVGSDYDAAANKLDIIGSELHLASWGNGVEAYNSYRRTSAPRNFQPTLQLNAGPWFRRFVYPQTFIALNGSTPPIDPTVVNKVFWDTNPETLN